MKLVFGYGSLIQSKSRLGTVPSAIESWPVEIEGLKRCWNGQLGRVGFSTSYLGVYEKEGFKCNGVAIFVDDSEIEALDRRESGYSKKLYSTSKINWLKEKPDEIPDSFLIYYLNKDVIPSPTFPIIQSYVDICMSGCLDIDKTIKSTDFQFTRSFIMNTHDWSKEWVNDRIQPRAPFRFCPQAGTIDRLLLESLPKEFKAIRLE